MKNLLARLWRAAAKAAPSPVNSRGGWFQLVHEPFAGAWQRNQELKQETVLASPIVYACMTLIANDIGKLRMRLVERDPDGIWKEVDRNSPYWKVLRKPNRFQNHIQFKQWWVMSKLRHGNTYALKERDARGVVVALYILDASHVTPLVADDGSIYYELKKDNLSGVQSESVTVPASEIIHDRMNCLYHPLAGISPLYAAAIAAGIGVKIQDNTATFFGNNSTPSGILIAPGNISSENAAELKAQWHANYGGANAGKVAVLGDGMKFEPMSQNAVDSQLIETLRWSDERICSVFHVPAYKVGVGDPPSHNNIEALDRAYYSDCLQSPIEELEACLDEGLGHDGVTIGVELDLDGLMRMDSKTQMETLKAGVDGGILTVNGARRRINEPPLDGGDTVYMQQQDFPLDQVRNNVISSAAPASPAEPQSVAEPSDEERALMSWALTQKAIHAAREKALQRESNAV
ncbi:MAG TPA: phage portal protein [Methylophilaceae bacterium]